MIITSCLKPLARRGAAAEPAARRHIPLASQGVDLGAIMDEVERSHPVPSHGQDEDLSDSF